MDKVTEIRLDRLDENQKATTIWLDGLDNRIAEMARDIAQIRTAIQPRDLPWAVRFLLLPLAVAAAVAMVGAVIHLEIAVDSMGKNVAGVRGEVARQTIAAGSALPSEEFKNTLPELTSAIAVARQQELRVSTKVMDGLQQRLTNLDTETPPPSFWPAAAEFISYRSLNKANGVFPRRLPNCTDKAPGPQRVKTVEDEYHFTEENALYENCQFTLDSPLDTERVNELLLHTTTGITFRNCVVTYRGGEIKLIVSFYNRPVRITASREGKTLPPVEGTVTNPSTLRFEHCLFNLTFSATPPPLGQQLAGSLLSANTETIDFPVQKPSTHS
jgi:hypothetical protein